MGKQDEKSEDAEKSSKVESIVNDSVCVMLYLFNYTSISLVILT